MNSTSAKALLLCSMVSLFCSAAQSNDTLVKPYDWTVEIKTKPMPHFFEYSGSHLRGIEKLKVTYVHSADATDPDPQPKDYENLWYHDGKPLGLERHNKFDLTKGEGVSILVSHKQASATDAECKAAANAILRLIVDSYLNKNAVVSVRCQPSSYERIKAYLEDQGCLENTSGNDQAIATAINIFFQNDSDANQYSNLYYQ